MQAKESAKVQAEIDARNQAHMGQLVAEGQMQQAYGQYGEAAVNQAREQKAEAGSYYTPPQVPPPVYTGSAQDGNAAAMPATIPATAPRSSEAPELVSPQLHTAASQQTWGATSPEVQHVK